MTSMLWKENLEFANSDRNAYPKLISERQIAYFARNANMDDYVGKTERFRILCNSVQ